ncbi:hypothetical protein TURU_086029 [Turdus rufiventris]|nr:hypothetical protein TURU_086029 [Turdus rufiventris]
MLDTGADVTIIAHSEWPANWPLQPVAGMILGIGGVSVSMQSKHNVIIEGLEGNLATIHPFVGNGTCKIPCVLSGSIHRNPSVRMCAKYLTFSTNCTFFSDTLSPFFKHLQYIDDIIVWGNTAVEVFEKGEKITQILLRAGFAIKKSKVKGPAREIQFLGVKWQHRRHQIPTEVINKITAMSPPTSKKETQTFLGAIGFWRMHIPEYIQIVSPLYLVTLKKNDFYWVPEQQ